MHSASTPLTMPPQVMENWIIVGPIPLGLQRLKQILCRDNPGTNPENIGTQTGQYCILACGIEDQSEEAMNPVLDLFLLHLCEVASKHAGQCKAGKQAMR